jgi:hypothetical protein
MILEPNAEAEPTLTDSARQLLEAAGLEPVIAEAADLPQGPGPGDEKIMSWARAM